VHLTTSLLCYFAYFSCSSILRTFFCYKFILKNNELSIKYWMTLSCLTLFPSIAMANRECATSWTFTVAWQFSSVAFHSMSNTVCWQMMFKLAVCVLVHMWMWEWICGIRHNFKLLCSFCFLISCYVRSCHIFICSSVTCAGCV